ncbi:SMI1/KNR4 family protein [Asticcacaulis machinosus]|uniref:SMI1/KNR4 family protein n=1 Tax=Asticcacaulis machinosus TaxID=2984211 RepID=A0ABT5HMH9_9CAUL|nr:SMI1/KNR4 family protein [Asticcacaulis machinosus]MDC7677445.1 SMI1/KNR4 family protein [Asticcacaulis machinosus]
MSLTLPQAKPASSTTLARLTETYGELPHGYQKFIGVHDGVTPPENVLRGTNNSIGVRSFIAASDILETAQSVDGLSDDLIPIADDDAGNFICLGVFDHKIYFWDHEVDRNEVIADSFEDFLERLDPFDLSQVQLEKGQVMRVWLNANFKPEF